MTDKVQKILSGIATRKLCTMDEHMAFYNDAAKEDYRFLSEIEELIKALQEEPVNSLIDFEHELYKAFGQVKDFTLGMRIAKHFFELGMQVSNPLTWEDINLIDHLLFDIKEDYDNGKLDKEKYYKEVLKKFKAQL